MNNFRIYFLAIFSFFLFVITACGSKKEKALDQKERSKVVVKYSGALAEMMHKGKVEAQLSLDTLNTEHLYGLGALADLKGELTVIDGKLYEVTVEESLAQLSNGDSAKVALFVYAQVPEWDTISVKGLGDVSAMLEIEIEKRQNLVPVPFQILAIPKQLNYHIINFTGEQPTKSNHKEGALVGSLSNEPVHILGFYAVNAEGIYTHHGSKTHMHFVDQSGKVSGHVDSLNISGLSVKILLPRI